MYSYEYTSVKEKDYFSSLCCRNGNIIILIHAIITHESTNILPIDDHEASTPKKGMSIIPKILSMNPIPEEIVARLRESIACCSLSFIRIFRGARSGTVPVMSKSHTHEGVYHAQTSTPPTVSGKTMEISWKDSILYAKYTHTASRKKDAHAIIPKSHTGTWTKLL